jgi:hypothetical protein
LKNYIKVLKKMLSKLSSYFKSFFNLAVTDGHQDDSSSGEESEEDSCILEQRAVQESSNVDCGADCTLCLALSEALLNDTSRLLSHASSKRSSLNVSRRQMKAPHASVSKEEEVIDKENI